MRYTNGDPNRDVVIMEEAREGVDWHRDGVEVHPYLLACLLLALALPVALTAFLVWFVL